MSRNNIGWGAPRIQGQLQMLGIQVSDATVAKYMIRYPVTCYVIGTVFMVSDSVNG